MKPSVGRIVHFYRKVGAAREYSGPFAAIVTRVYQEADQPVDLTIFDWGGVTRPERLVSTEEFNGQRYWVWPPRDAAPAPAVIDPKALPAPAVPEAVILSGYVPAIVNDNPDPLRRRDTKTMTTVEVDIMNATTAVENIGAHPWLTDAIVLLAKAREKVANYIDHIPPDEWDTKHFPPRGCYPAGHEQRVDDTGEDIDPGLRA
jgi:hypothetical protein